MNAGRAARCLALGLLASVRVAAQDSFDRLADALSFASADGSRGVRFSGQLDLEYYAYDRPAPGLIYAERSSLFNPRLSLFADAQAGPGLYLFAQVRADRGFDPSDEPLTARLDEFAVRYSPGRRGGLNLQVGQFATVVGNWSRLHDSWGNPFITAPLAYEELTGLWDVAAPRSANVLLSWAHLMPPFPADGYADKHLRLPLIWGPNYASGIAVFGEWSRWNYALELKNAALASRPDSWGLDRAGWERPAVNGRLGFRPNMMWDLGVSAGRGTFLTDAAGPTLPRGTALEDYRETVVGQDLRFAWHYWQVWAEVYEVRFRVPRIGDADVVSWYLAAKYKVTPRLAIAVRWNEQSYGAIQQGRGERPWGRDVRRLDVSPVLRFTAHVQLKLQGSLRRAAGEGGWDRLFGAQLTTRF